MRSSPCHRTRHRHPVLGLAEHASRDYRRGVDSAIEILGLLVGAAMLPFLLISLIVLMPGRSRRRGTPSGAIWLGGPDGGEHGVSTSGLVLTGHPARWAERTRIDWPAAAETAEPGRRSGGASAGW